MWMVYEFGLQLEARRTPDLFEGWVLSQYYFYFGLK